MRPSGVFFDLSVLAAAPLRMMRAGLGDTVCRTTAQVDWLLSHLLLDTVYAETPYRLMEEDEPRLYAQAASAARARPRRHAGADPDADPLRLRRAGDPHQPLRLDGRARDQPLHRHLRRPAPQDPARRAGRHRHLEHGAAAVGAAGRSRGAGAVAAAPSTRTRYRQDYGRLAPACLDAVRRKPFDAAGTERLNRRLAERWPTIRARLLPVMLPLSRDRASDAGRRSPADRRRAGRGPRPLPARGRRGPRAARPLRLPRPRRPGRAGSRSSRPARA